MCFGNALNKKTLPFTEKNLQKMETKAGSNSSVGDDCDLLWTNSTESCALVDTNNSSSSSNSSNSTNSSIVEEVIKSFNR
jgi:hypothetical protein